MLTCTLPNLKLKTLAAVSQIIDTTLDLETALHNVLRILSDTLSMERGTITLEEGDAGRLVIAASYGLTLEEKRRGVYKLGEGVTGNIFRTAQPYYVEDIHADPLFLDKTGARRLERGRLSFIGVPILKQGQPIGVLNVDRLFGDEVSPDEDMEFLGVVATLVAQFISLNEQVTILKRENATLKHTVLKKEGRYAIGTSHSMQSVQNQLERVAPTKATVLLLGESGVGKTLIAQLIHDLSDRQSKPFVKVNCASIPANLLEAELFGHEKGAFTGASGSRIGRFEEADGGTIFLDEIGELDLALQAKLLRVLQEKEFERIGSNKTRIVDARILAATNRNLSALSETGEFRQDLYFRLHVFPIAVPPLRERQEDIPSLLGHFMTRMSGEYGRKMQLDMQAQNILCQYSWPGNVREMEHVVERLAILVEREVITALDVTPLLEPEHAGGASSSSAAMPYSATSESFVDFSGSALCRSDQPYSAQRLSGLADGALPVSFEAEPQQSLRDAEVVQVLNALRRNDWIQHKAASELGISARQIGYRIRKFNLTTLVAMERAKAKLINS